MEKVPCPNCGGYSYIKVWVGGAIGALCFDCGHIFEVPKTEKPDMAILEE